MCGTRPITPGPPRHEPRPITSSATSSGTNRFEQTGAKIAASLAAPTAFAFGADVLGEYEYASVGVSPENWSDSPYSFALSLWMLLLDSLLYTALALYLDRVLPSLVHNES